MALCRKGKLSIVLAAVGVSIVGAFGGVQSVSAAELSMGSEFMLERSASSSENIYVAAERIAIEGAVVGDALLLGEDITVSGTTTQDLMLAGKEVALSGVVLGDARVIAARAHIDGTYSGDVMVVANSALFRSGFQSEGDMRVYASHLVYRGVSAQDVVFRGRTIEINGVVEGDVTVSFGEYLIIGDEARISGSVLYEGPREPQISSGAVIQGLVDGDVVSRAVRGDMYLTKLGDVVNGAQVVFALSSALTSILLVILFPRFSNRAVRYVVRRGVPSIGYGFLFFVLGILVGIVLLISVFGLYLGLLVLFGLLVISMLAGLLTPALAGALIAQWIVKEYRVTWYWVIAGVVALELLLWVPVIGPVVRILMYLAVLGSLARGIYDIWWTRRKDDAVS